MSVYLCAFAAVIPILSIGPYHLKNQRFRNKISKEMCLFLSFTQLDKMYGSFTDIGSDNSDSEMELHVS